MGVPCILITCHPCRILDNRERITVFFEDKIISLVSVLYDVVVFSMNKIILLGSVFFLSTTDALYCIFIHENPQSHGLFSSGYINSVNTYQIQAGWEKPFLLVFFFILNACCSVVILPILNRQVKFCRCKYLYLIWHTCPANVLEIKPKLNMDPVKMYALDPNAPHEWCLSPTSSCNMKCLWVFLSHPSPLEWMTINYSV